MQITARARLEIAGASLAKELVNKAEATTPGSQGALASPRGADPLRGQRRFTQLLASLGLEASLSHDADQELVHVEANSGRGFGELALVGARG